jgi:hypothetical protein
MRACRFHDKYVAQRRHKKVLLPATWTFKTESILLERYLAVHACPAMKMPQKQGIVRYSTFPNFLLMIACDA